MGCDGFQEVLERLEGEQPGVKVVGGHALFEGMSWPMAGEQAADLEYALRHGPEGTAGMRERMSAATIISAYIELVNCPRRKREDVVRGLRRAAGIEAAVRVMAAVQSLFDGRAT